MCRLREIPLQEQLDDVRSTRRELSKVIRQVDHEIQSVFAAAFADVLARRAESCEGDAAEVMREWEDSVRMLERTEQVAGIEARNWGWKPKSTSCPRPARTQTTAGRPARSSTSSA